jgi:lipocalin
MKFRFQVARVLLAVVMLAYTLLPAQAHFTQQAKLVGTGAIGRAGQGQSVSISAEGNTAIVGGPDDSGVGAAWVYSRSGKVWNQQAKLVGTGSIGPFDARQGWSVSLSGDGNTAIVGGPDDNGLVGAAWVFTRSREVWTQHAKLVGTGAIGPYAPEQGSSVSLSGDGNTAIVGGICDAGCIGAAWVFVRSREVWTQQAKLVGTGAIGTAEQGLSVSLSGDGNTAIVGGPDDNGFVGAAWVFVRSREVWTQQASLVGTGAIGPVPAFQGSSVSLSGDGNTAIVGGIEDNSRVGAAWVFKRSREVHTSRSREVWTQQAKLVGTAIGRPDEGLSVSLSGDGNTAIVGGPDDNGLVGAAWVFTRTREVWTQQAKLVGTGAIGRAGQGQSVSISAEGSTAIVGGPSDNSVVGAAWVYVQRAFGMPGEANCHEPECVGAGPTVWRSQ